MTLIKRLREFFKFRKNQNKHIIKNYENGMFKKSLGASAFYGIKIESTDSKEDIELINKLNRKYKQELQELKKNNQLTNIEFKTHDFDDEQKRIQSKKYITPKEFQKIYNISTTRQGELRSVITNPLPFHQIAKRGKVTYNIEEVEKWLENCYR